MNTLLDQLMGKMEEIVGHPSRLMAVADATLKRLARNDSAAAYPCWDEYYTSPCYWTQDQHGEWFLEQMTYQRRCCAQGSNCNCGDWWELYGSCCM